jgi:hypothetical protein
MLRRRFTHWIRMRRFLVRFSESEASNHTPSLADFTTTTPSLSFRYIQRPLGARTGRSEESAFDPERASAAPLGDNIGLERPRLIQRK